MVSHVTLFTACCCFLFTHVKLDSGLSGEEIENEEMDGVEEVVEKEQELNFKDFISSFASPRILPVYTLLLSLYKTNDLQTNHCVIKMLHRIAVQVRLTNTLTYLHRNTGSLIIQNFLFCSLEWLPCSSKYQSSELSRIF